MIAVKVNAEKEGVTQAKHYEVTGYPMILFLNEKGEVEGKIGGYLAAKEFSEQMTRFISGHTEYPSLQDRVKKNPGDIEALAKLEGMTASRGDASQAETLLAKLETADPKNDKGLLAKAYNDLGDSYQEKQKFDKAIPFFAKAVKTGKTPKETAYAHISMAVCYLSQNKIKDAVPELNATAAVPDCPADLKAQAQQYLSLIKQRGLDKK